MSFESKYKGQEVEDLLDKVKNSEFEEVIKDCVLSIPQELTNEQKTQARINIGVDEAIDNALGDINIILEKIIEG